MEEEIKKETVGSATLDDMAARLRNAEVKDGSVELSNDAENARREAEFDEILRRIDMGIARREAEFNDILLRIDAQNTKLVEEVEKILQRIDVENARLRAENEELQKHL